MLETTMEFMQVLFGEKPEDLYLLLWTLPDRRSYWFKTVEEFSMKAQELKARQDVYVGVALSPENFGAERRCATKFTAGIIGLWADVDILDPHHKKGNLPPDERAALGMISEMGIEPTVIIHSGHGLQAWWAFKEPWIFTDEKDREQALTLSEAWTNTMRAKAKARGWDADSTFDLARVLRVPGTVNRKGEPVPTKIISLQLDNRYDPSEFDPYLMELAKDKKRSTYARGEAGPLDLDPEAKRPYEKFDMLAEVEPKFLQSWNRTRKEMQDQSGSSYDLSLATFAAQVGWTDQEITNLIIESRRKHNDDLKLRQDYYARTIWKARDALRKDEAQEAIENYAAELASDVENGLSVPIQETPEKMQDVVDKVSTTLGVRIKRIVKYMSDPPQFRLETANASIMIGDVQNLIGQSQFRNKVAAVAGKVIPNFKPKDWRNISQLLLNLCVEEELGEESTDRGMAKMWIEEYLSEKTPLDDMEGAVGSKHPFVKDADTYIFLADLQRWLFLNNNAERLTTKEIGRVLKTYDCQPKVLAVRLGLKDTTRSVWKLPK